MTLTTSWQNVASYTFEPGTGFKAVFYLDAKYSTQSKTNITTTVQTRLNCDVQSGSGGGNGYRYTLSYANTREGSGYWTFEDETIMTGESTIRHNEDGSKSITLSASMRVNYTGLDASMSATVDLPKIDRYPMIITAPDFSDEDDPTVTFTTTLGFSDATVQIGIFDSTGNTNYVPYRNIPDISEGNYTFHLDNTERATLRNATPSSNEMDVMFKLTTTTTSQTFNSPSTKKMRIVNANPTIETPTIAETNAKVVAVLGTSANTIIQNASLVSFGITPTALKGSSITKVEITHNNTPYSDDTSPYNFIIPITTNNFLIKAYDSRGNINNNGSGETITKTLIEYMPVDITSLSMKRVNPTSSNIVLNLEATYYQKTFGSTANVPTVKWKLGDGTYTTIPSSAYTIDTTNNKLTISNYTLSNVLDYRNPGTFTISIEDLLTSDTDARNVTQGIPTFDAGEHDLKVNGKIYLADEDGQNPVEVGTGGGDTLPINAIVDYNGSSVPDGYELVEEYSTSEIKTSSIWIDNKPIYRKIFTGSSISTISTGLTTIDNVIKMEMLVRENASSKSWRNIPWLYNSTDTNWMGGFFFRADNGNISFQIGNSLKNIDRYIIIMEYTKTTD